MTAACRCSWSGPAGHPCGRSRRPPAPASVVRQASTHGVLALTLRDGGYDWRFVPVAGGMFSDTGTAECD